MARRSPEYIHEQRGWPRLEWDAASVGELLASVRHKQGLLVGRMSALGGAQQTEASVAVAERDVVKSSAIEGEVLDPREVRSSIARRLGRDVTGLPVPSRDVDGVVEMTLDATGDYASPVTAERLFRWHAALFPRGRSGGARITVGAWRALDSGPMQVLSGPLGKERVHFEAPAPARVPSEMAAFLEWLNARSSDDPVVRAGLAHLWFVTVHPFEDGNGRIARALTDLCLARADGTSHRFYSLSTRLEAERADYYRALESAQRGGLEVTRWLRWFLSCLGRAFDDADSILAVVLRNAALWQRLADRPLHERQRLVVRRLLDGFEGHLTTSKYAKLAKCSTDTALRDIHELVDWGVLVKNTAAGRSTSYRIRLSTE